MTLGDHLLPCRRGLVFVGRRDHSAWHAVIYDLPPDALKGIEGEGPLAFAAMGPDGLLLEGMAQLGSGDAQTRMLYVAGVGRLRKGAQTIAALEYVRTETNVTKAEVHRR